MKVAWSAGHYLQSKGAYSAILDEREYDIAKDVVDYGISLLKNLDDVEVLKVSSAPLSEKVKEINNWGAEIAIESHFNSFHDTRAHGCETLYFSLPGTKRFSTNGKILARLIQLHTLLELDMASPHRTVKDRGAKGMGSFLRLSGNREIIPRYSFLTKTKMPAVICEPLFISSPSDTYWLSLDRDNEIERLARGVVHGIMAFKESDF